MNDDLNETRLPSRQSIVVLYVAAVVVRLVIAFWFGDHVPHIVDARDYDGLAQRILESGSYISRDGEPISLRPPLFPLLVAGVYSLFGVANYVAVALVQSILSLLTMAIAHVLGTRLFNAQVGWMAAAITGFYPSLLAFNGLVLSESLFTFFCILAVFASVQLQRQAFWGWAVLLGLCLGLGALTRSILWVCSVPLLIYLFCTIESSIRQRAVLTAVSFVTLSAVLAPWVIRNTTLHQTFTVVDVMGGRNVMMGNYEYTPLERSWATVSDVQGDKAWTAVLAQAHPETEGMTQGQLDKVAMRYGIKYFFTHPVESAKRSVVRFFNFWQLERSIVAGMRKGIWGDVSKPTLLVTAAVICGAYVMVVFGSIFGILVSPLSWRLNGLLLLWLALPCAIHTAAFAHSRYHLPLVPILAVYAASFFCQWREGKQMSPFAMNIAIALCFVFVLGWTREIVMVDLALF